MISSWRRLSLAAFACVIGWCPASTWAQFGYPISAPASLNTNAASDTGGDAAPGMATDGAGTWVAVWSSSENLGGTIGTDSDILVARSSDNGATWSAPAALNTNAGSDSGSDVAPFVAPGGPGVWVAAWFSNENLGGSIGTDFDILYSRSTNSGVTWSAPAVLNSAAASDGAGSDTWPVVTSDRAGNWVAVWSSTANLGGAGADEDIFTARSSNDGATWTAQTVLPTNATSDSGNDAVPAVATDGAGNWIAVWDSTDSLGGTIGTDSDILVARSADGGASWTAPMALNTNAATDSGGDTGQVIASDGAGNWVVLWYSSDSLGGAIGTDDDVLVARSTDNGATWTAPTPFNTNAAVDTGYDDEPVIATDGAGHWVGVWYGNDSLGGTIGTDTDEFVARFEISLITDCNNNGVEDDDDIAGPTSDDCDGSSIPDECESFGVGGRLYVDQSASGADDGSSWADALPELRMALCIAANDAGISEIWVADGTYRPTTPGGDRAISFQLLDGVSIYGGFASGETSLGQRDIQTYIAILSGDLNGDDGARGGGGSSENSYHVTIGSDGAVLDGVTVSGGNANGPEWEDKSGGGMYNFNASPTVVHCTFQGNSADRYGGGVYDSASSPTLTDCTFNANTAAAGGGMTNEDLSSPTLTDCAFDGNSAPSGDGGGMLNLTDCNPALTNCTFDNNTAAPGGGGGLENLLCSPTLTDCSFTGNLAGYGGGIYNDLAHPTLTGCTFTMNDSSGWGGGVANDAGAAPILTNCTFDGNTSADGGGMYNVEGAPTLTDCVFTGNVATNGGGGILNDNASNPTLTGCTFTMNTAMYAGAIYNFNASSPDLIDCDFTGNSATLPDGHGGAMFNDQLGSPTLTGCTFTDNSAEAGGAGMYNEIGASPILTDCAFNGNVAMTYGGGMYNYSCDTMLINCTFALNTATGYGGGVYNSGGALTASGCQFDDNAAEVGGGMAFESDVGSSLDSCDFSGNTSADAGGGVYLSVSPVTITNCTFDSNVSGNSGGGGLAIDDFSHAMVTGCNFNANDASNTSGGGVWINNISLPTLDGCTFTLNNASVGGGAAIYEDSDASISNCTFDENTALVGGGLLIDHSSPTLTDCNLGGNSATDAGGMMISNSSAPTLTRCDFTGNMAGPGGGMYIASSSPELSECTFSMNVGNGGGGGVFVDFVDSFPTLTDCTFSENQTAGDGGGMVVDNSSNAALTRCIFTSNSACSGGGLSNFESNILTLTDCVFSGNSSCDQGGGMTNQFSPLGGVPMLTNCTFSGNSAAGNGGGISNVNSAPNLTNCVLTGNSASRGGAIYHVDGSGGSITHCVFNGNEASDGAGAMWIDMAATGSIRNSIFTGNMNSGNGYPGGAMFIDNDAAPEFVNCLFAGNFGGDSNGGASWNNGPCTPAFINCTFIRNSTNGQTGGALLNEDPGSSIVNCIFWDNLASSDGELGQYDGPPEVVSYSLVQGLDTLSGNGNIGGDPLFAGKWTGEWDTQPTYDADARQVTFENSNVQWTPGSLAGRVLNPDVSQPLYFLIVDNTETTITVWADYQTISNGGSGLSGSETYEFYDPHLLMQSPAIDAGDNAPVPGDVTTDLDGQHGRFYDHYAVADTGSGAPPIVDMGAYEVFPDCNGNGELDNEDIANLVSADCNTNWLPDECEVAAGSSQDCNTNTLLDACEIAGMTALDCNTNGMPDPCDIVTPDYLFTLTDLGTLGGPYAFPTALSPDNRVGLGTWTAGVEYHLALWQAGELTDITAVYGGDVIDINGVGQVVYNANPSGGDNYAFLWDNGMTTDLGTLGGSHSRAAAINDAGQIVGQAATLDDGDRAFLWESGVMSNLGSLGGGHSAATGINNAGLIIGWSMTAGDPAHQHACIFTGGGPMDIQPPGTHSGDALRVNASGQIVGYFNALGAEHGFLYDNGVFTDLGTLGGIESIARDINDNGQIVGQSQIMNGQVRAFLWENGVMTDLGTLGGDESVGMAINNAGHIVGRTRNAQNEARTFFWRDGTMLSIEDNLPPDISLDYMDAVFYGLNNHDKMIVAAGLNGQDRAFLVTALTPDCNSDGVLDTCETDCNTNTIPDECDIAQSTSGDDNNDGTPNECENNTQLILTFGNNGRAAEDCIQPGSGTNETLTVRVELSDAARPITGGQFFMAYDAGVIEFVSAVPGDEPFTREVFESVDGMNGALSYAVGIENEGLATTADTTMAVITFRAIGEQCAETTLLRFSDPGSDLPPTRLSDDNDGEVLAALIDLQTITSDFTAPNLLVPPDISVHSDAGECQATFTTFVLAAATDNCDTNVTITFSRDDSQPNLLDPYQPGTTTITWTAEDNCGNTTIGTQTIIVSDQNEVLVDVELSPTLDDTNGPFAGATLQRCITFQAWECPGGAPLAESSTEVIFPADALQIHRTNGVSVLLPCDVYTCLTARDTLHTLRSTAPDFTDDGTTYIATYVGNRTTGGHWMLHGNLNDDRFIDILDFGSFVIRFQSTYDSDFDTFIDGHTDCSTPLFHADISGDGRVFTEDFTFIQINFLKRHEDNCCGATGADEFSESSTAASRVQRDYSQPVTSISVPDLWRMGMGELAAADLNGDGLLDAGDMETFSRSQAGTVHKRSR